MKKVFLCFFALAVMFLAACGDKTTTKEDIIVEFEGANSITVSVDGIYDLPEIDLTAGQSLLGWALKADANKALFKEDIAYADIEDYASENKLKLYPVIETKIKLTMKGLNDAVTNLSDMENNQATLPLVAQTDRQKFIGWANTEDAVEAQIASDANITYGTVERLAVNGEVILFPVIESYDIMICVHASHSNGNIYVSTEQKAELKAALEAQFADANILIDFIDAVSATNFANEAVKKDYDIVLSSKSARFKSDEEPGDIMNAATIIAKAMYAEKDDNETVLSCIELSQSRQVCRILGTDATKTYQDQVYTFLTTPIDKVVEVKFVQGEKQEVISAHRVVDGIINNIAYQPSAESGIMTLTGKVFDGWTTVENGTEVEFANASYANVAKIAVDGKVTLYPVFKDEPDAYFLVWGMNGDNEYISQAQYEQIVELFNAYLVANNISKEGKDVQLIYFEGKTADFQSELTKPYVTGAIGASALSNETYAAYWTINPEMYAKVLNVACTNTSRYVALRNGTETNEFAVAFFKTLCEKEITVKFSNGTTTSAEFKANSLTKNVIELPAEFAAPANKVLSGYALEQTGEVVLTGNVTYATIAEYAENGEVTLYPQYEDDSHYDLTVAILRGTATKEYITLAEVDAIKAAFTAYAAAKGIAEVNVEYIVNDGAAGADFIAALPATTDVYVGASNLTSQTGFPGMYAGENWTVIINLIANTSRYCGVVGTCDATQYDLAKMFVEMLTVKEQEQQEETEKITVTVAYNSTGAKSSTVYVSDAMLNKIKADVATALTEAGYTADDYEINWVAYSGNVANASAAIVAGGYDVCLAHTQTFDSAKTDTPIVCAETAPGVVFTNKTEGNDLYCASNLKVGVKAGSETNPIAMIIYNVIAAYAPAE